MFICREYRENLNTFQVADGIKAILLYAVYIIVLLVQGWTYTTDLSVGVLNKLQIVFPLSLLFIGILFIVLSKNKLCTVGLNTSHFLQSILIGIVLAMALLIAMTMYFIAMGKTSFSINLPALSALGIFAVGAMQEEIIFRGYIQTRLAGIIRQPVICSLCTAFLFLAMHYPTRWVVDGFSLSTLSLFYVIILIVLHFVCDFAYKKTNCLWGAIILHFLYNVGQSMLSM